MGGNTKDKKDAKTEKDILPRGRGFDIRIGMKVEAMDYLGTWYNARILKLKPEKKEVLIHFDGWNSRFDVWLPYDSKKLREAKPAKPKGQDWRVGSRVVAKWGPANKIYPAIVSRIISDNFVEVRFYDGFKKSLKKSSLQPDTEKLYRQYGEGSAIKDIFNQSVPLGGKKAVTPTNSQDKTASSLRAKRRLTEPPGMADYVTDIHKKRRSLKGTDMSSEDDKSSIHGEILTSPEILSPVSSAVMSPVSSAVMSPVSSAVMSPVSSTAISPVSSTAISPVSSRAISPVSSTATSPVSSTLSNDFKKCIEKETPFILSKCSYIDTSNNKISCKSSNQQDEDISGKECSENILKIENLSPNHKQNIDCQISSFGGAVGHPDNIKSPLEFGKQKEYTQLHSIPKLTLRKGNRPQSNVEIVRNKFHSYMMFPILSSPEDSDDNSNSPTFHKSEPRWEISTPVQALEENKSRQAMEKGNSPILADDTISDEANLLKTELVLGSNRTDSLAKEGSPITQEECNGKENNNTGVCSKQEKKDKLISRQTGVIEDKRSRKAASLRTIEKRSVENSSKESTKLLTDMLFKLPENTREMRRRKSEPINVTHTNSSETLQSKEKIKKEEKPTEKVVECFPKEDFIDAPSKAIIVVQDESDDDKLNNDSEDDQPLMAVKLSKEGKLSTLNLQKSNTVERRSKRISDEKKVANTISVDENVLNQRTLRRDTRSVEDTKKNAKNTLKQFDNSSQNKFKAGEKKDVGETLRRSSRETIVTKMKTKDDIGSKSPSNNIERRKEHQFTDNGASDSSSSERRSSRTRSSLNAGEQKKDNLRLKSQNDIAKQNLVKLEPRSPSVNHKSTHKESSFSYDEKRPDEKAAGVRSLRHRDSRSKLQDAHQQLAVESNRRKSEPTININKSERIKKNVVDHHTTKKTSCSKEDLMRGKGKAKCDIDIKHEASSLMKVCDKKTRSVVDDGTKEYDPSQDLTKDIRRSERHSASQTVHQKMSDHGKANPGTSDQNQVSAIKPRTRRDSNQKNVDKFDERNKQHSKSIDNSDSAVAKLHDMPMESGKEKDAKCDTSNKRTNKRNSIIDDNPENNKNEMNAGETPIRKSTRQTGNIEEHDGKTRHGSEKDEVTIQGSSKRNTNSDTQLKCVVSTDSCDDNSIRRSSRIKTISKANEDADVTEDTKDVISSDKHLGHTPNNSKDTEFLKTNKKVSSVETSSQAQTRESHKIIDKTDTVMINEKSKNVPSSEKVCVIPKTVTPIPVDSKDYNEKGDQQLTQPTMVRRSLRVKPDKDDSDSPQTNEKNNGSEEKHPNSLDIDDQPPVSVRRSSRVKPTEKSESVDSVDVKEEKGLTKSDKRSERTESASNKSNILTPNDKSESTPINRLRRRTASESEKIGNKDTKSTHKDDARSSTGRLLRAKPSHVTEEHRASEDKAGKKSVETLLRPSCKKLETTELKCQSMKVKESEEKMQKLVTEKKDRKSLNETIVAESKNRKSNQPLSETQTPRTRRSSKSDPSRNFDSNDRSDEKIKNNDGKSIISSPNDDDENKDSNTVSTRRSSRIKTSKSNEESTETVVTSTKNQNSSLTPVTKMKTNNLSATQDSKNENRHKERVGGTCAELQPRRSSRVKLQPKGDETPTQSDVAVIQSTTSTCTVKESLESNKKAERSIKHVRPISAGDQPISLKSQNIKEEASKTVEKCKHTPASDLIRIRKDSTVIISIKPIEMDGSPNSAEKTTAEATSDELNKKSVEEGVTENSIECKSETKEDVNSETQTNVEPKIKKVKTDLEGLGEEKHVEKKMKLDLITSQENKEGSSGENEVNSAEEFCAKGRPCHEELQRSEVTAVIKDITVKDCSIASVESKVQSTPETSIAEVCTTPDAPMSYVTSSAETPLTDTSLTDNTSVTDVSLSTMTPVTDSSISLETPVSDIQPTPGTPLTLVKPPPGETVLEVKPEVPPPGKNLVTPETPVELQSVNSIEHCNKVKVVLDACSEHVLPGSNNTEEISSVKESTSNEKTAANKTPSSASLPKYEKPPVVNIFQEIVPDLNSGRPIRKNKLKKPARYSNESDEPHTKTKKDLKETTTSKSGVNNEKTISKVRRDSKDKKGLSTEKGDVRNESKEKKSLVSQENISTIKLSKEEKEKEEAKIKSVENQLVKTNKIKDVNDKKAGTSRPRRDSKEKETSDEMLGARRNENKIPVKGGKIIKPKISLQTVTGRKHGVVNKKFEEKYEMFKKKWKEEKERRRMLQQQEVTTMQQRQAIIGTTTHVKKAVGRPGKVLKTNITGLEKGAGGMDAKKDISDQNIAVEEAKTSTFESEDLVKNADACMLTKPLTMSPSVRSKLWKEKVTPKLRSRIKHTPHSKFGKVSRVQSPVKNVNKKIQSVFFKNDSTSKNNDINAKKDEVIASEVNPPSSSEDNVVKGSEGDSNSQDDKSNTASSKAVDTGDKSKQRIPKKVRQKRKKKLDHGDYIPDPEDQHKMVRDVSRTPSETISFASMIEDERPSQKKRPEVSSQSNTKKSPVKYPTLSPQKVFAPRFIVPSYHHRPYFAFAPRQNAFPSAAQIAASRIQKRVHHQKLMSMLNSPEHQPYKANVELCNYPPESSQFSSYNEKVKGSTASTEDDSDDSILVVQPSDETTTTTTTNDRRGSSEINIMDITLNEASKEGSDVERAPFKKRESLDFITARLKYKQKVERQRIDSVVGRLKNNQAMDSGKSPEEQFDRSAVSSCTPSNSEGIPHPSTFIQPPNITASRDPNFISQMTPMMMSVPPIQPDGTMFVNLPMQRMALPMGTVMTPMNARVLTPAQPQHLIPIQGNHLVRHPEFTNVHNYRPAVIGCPPTMEHHMIPRGYVRAGPHHHAFRNPAVVTSHMQHQPHPHVGGMPIPSYPTKQISLEDVATVKGNKDKKVDEVSDTRSGDESRKDLLNSGNVTSSAIPKDDNADSCKKTDETKKRKKQTKNEKENVYAFRREKRLRSPKEMLPGAKKVKTDSEKPSQASQAVVPKDVSVETGLNEYKCNIADCGKVFRKSHLLEYHIKYFHTVKPFQKRSRSSASVSSVETSPIPAASVAAVDSSPKVIPGLVHAVDEMKAPSSAPCSEVELTEQSDSTISESESESEDEIPSVDDCVKCVCEDECELGFMIQCEQCFTWQHGECVGYSSPKAVPLFYLCHVCSNPKGLRKSSQYDNDYTWYRHGLLPPLRQDAPDEKQDEIEAGKHVDLENEEILSTIMLTTHAMMTDLYNIRDVLQEVRNKFILIKDPDNPELLKWKGENDEEVLSCISQKIKESDDLKRTDSARNKHKKITEKFDEDLNQRLVSINNKNAQQNISTNKTVLEKINDKDNIVDDIRKDNEISNVMELSSSASCDSKVDDGVDNDVFVVVSSIVQMICGTVEKDSNRPTTSCSEHVRAENFASTKPKELFEKSKIITDSSDDGVSTKESHKDTDLLNELHTAKMSTERSTSENIVATQEESSDIHNQRTCLDKKDTILGNSIVKDIIEDIVNKVCERHVTSIDDKMENTVLDINDITHAIMKEDQSTSSRIPKQDVGEKQSLHPEAVKSVETTPTVKPTSENLTKTTDDTDSEFIDVANISEEDSIPYMETDDDFFPSKDNLNCSIETESTLPSFESEGGGCFRQLSCHGIDNILKDGGDWSNSSRASLIARYNVLVEIEKIEDQVNERLEDMNAKLDELEAEYDSIDKSKAILEDFKRNFKLPDLKSLMNQLNDVKWKSIVKSNMEPVPA